MLRRAVLAMAIIAGILVGNAVPAQAIPPGPTLLVLAYYSDASKTVLVGQQWSGCGQPSGSWGTTSPYRNVFFTPC
jgi:hypothetical protein